MPVRPRRRPRQHRAAAVALALVGLLSLTVTTASSATTTGYAAVEPFGGTTGAYTTSVTLPGLGRPEASMTSTSTSGSAVGRQNGATTFLPASSPPGARFGSSRNQPYVNLAAARGGGPSVTTYTFAGPMPVGWGFVLGDVDADAVQVAATGATGAALTADQLGFQDRFNYAGQADLPTWDVGTATLTGSGSNTDGAAGWFEPTVPVRTLTLMFRVQTGFPTYQTWFAAVDRSVSGTITDSSPTGTSCDVTTTEVRLLDAAGTVLATRHPDADGGYAFARVAAAPGFRVEVAGVPTGCTPVGGASRPVDLSQRDATADFEVRHAPLPAAVPVTAGGAVTGADGAGVADARVSVRDQAGKAVGDDITDADGRYEVDGSAQGDVTITLDPPSGYVVVGSAARTVDVPAGGGPVSADFRVRRTATRGSTGSTGSAGSSGTGSASMPVSATVGGLPDTGGPPVLTVWVGAGLALLGAGLVLAGRRQRVLS